MAAFCTRCGVALSPGTQFCTACGALAAPPGIPSSAAAASAYAQPAPAYGQPAPSGTSPLKVILIVVGVLIGLALLSILLFAFGVWRVSRTIHANGGGHGLILSTPGGTVTTGGASSVSDADLGIPIYPGAARGEGGLRVQSADGDVFTATYSTPDPPGKVIDFYKSNLPADASVMESGRGALITSGNKEKESWMITVNGDSSEGGKTRITIMHAKKP
jgi:hypothetical protein